ncbi:response regulator [Cohnella zeiphila]|uniref:Response regulator n=1 Tax=Cohnella zeiphila TaxID=2761120 RepID=A0A7X0VTT8_9BACL|nr:response regulator [Cohnella zeiphila]MBB6730239.1 response regulator [Cohnella zeiphila]
MYKAILVDDEPVVREGLKKTIAWNEHGFELIGDYENGREAWEAACELKPDLIVSDICMPFMDGLELAGLVATTYPYMKMIILTGYDQFEYAQQAIRLKVRDFVLKPITAREMRELLDKVRAEMDEEAKRLEDLGRLQSQLSRSLPLLKERFLERLAALGMAKPEIEEGFAYFGLGPLKPPALAIAADIDDFGERDAWLDDEHDAEFLRFAVFNIFEETAAERGNALVFRTREERSAAIVYGADDEDELHDAAFGLAEDVRHRVEKYLKLTVTLGIGHACSSAEQLPLSYKSALSALDYRFLHGKNRVHGIRDLEGAAPDTTFSLPDEDRKLATAIKTGASEEAFGLIERMVARLRSSQGPMEICYLELQKVVLTLLNAIQELDRNGADGVRTAGRTLWLTDLYRFKTLEEIERWLKRTVADLIEEIAAGRSHHLRAQMAKAETYIEERYADEKLSLRELCRHVLMSASYFSLAFKQETGETFVEYLTRVRIEKAKELLAATPLKFYEIAERVGYADPNYFSVLFKKHTGATPRDFRERLAQERVP